MNDLFYFNNCFALMFMYAVGLQKLGIAAAFVNFHLKSKPLARSIKSSDAKILIVGEGKRIKFALMRSNT